MNLNHATPTYIVHNEILKTPPSSSSITNTSPVMLSLWGVYNN